MCITARRYRKFSAVDFFWRRDCFKNSYVRIASLFVCLLLLSSISFQDHVLITVFIRAKAWSEDFTCFIGHFPPHLLGIEDFLKTFEVAAALSLPLYA
jgi:hypothetical protein